MVVMSSRTCGPVRPRSSALHLCPSRPQLRPDIGVRVHWDGKETNQQRKQTPGSANAQTTRKQILLLCQAISRCPTKELCGRCGELVEVGIVGFRWCFVPRKKKTRGPLHSNFGDEVRWMFTLRPHTTTQRETGGGGSSTSGQPTQPPVKWAQWPAKMDATAYRVR